jgi:hypothetical protein
MTSSQSEESLDVGFVFGSRIALPGKAPVKPELSVFSYGANDADIDHQSLQRGFHGVTSLRSPGQLALYTWVEFCHSAKGIQLHGRIITHADWSSRPFGDAPFKESVRDLRREKSHRFSPSESYRLDHEVSR